ncbi:hypothetical protein B9G69_006755 [Bdellovibrio sp. SKB1291214]|uniref:hypothetical protein n=1 Tax=Bdellovibrio sp. SKB1291214 TaxID=1732569 RepID=UPI000B517B91|nr:hypothetical protein [Bdellovibrio sp. SKB1291214]UYL10277.1 hypothetical protein B9G69_006755 [Bdellovibrio sp. SKB1291214]
MKAIGTILFLMLPTVCLGKTYDCLIEHKDTNPEKNKKVWSGNLTPKGLNEAKAEVVIVNADGTGTSVEKVVGVINDASALGEKLKPYNTLLAIGLKEEAGKLVLTLGHVDISKTGNMIPFDAISWSSTGTTLIGVKDLSRDLEVSCRAK